MTHSARFIDRVLSGQDRYYISSLALMALTGAASAAAGAYENYSNTKNQQKLTAAELAAQAAARDQQTALQESLANPFRHQAAQMATASGLDSLANASYTPVTFNVPSKMAAYVPKMSGGFSYTKSPALVNAAKAAETDVLAGHTAPTMTNPANYGKTAALSLDANGNPTGATTRPGIGGAGTGPTSLSDLTASYDRRGGGTGGVLKGAAQGAIAGSSVVPGIGTAIGAGVGTLVGAATKHASTAPTDFKVDDARDAVSRAITYYQGRQPDTGEVDAILKGQGWKPGDRWVGAGGLNSVLSSIAGLPPATAH